MSEYIKLTLFMLGLICIVIMAPVFSWLCLIPGVWFWSVLHALNWLLEDDRWVAEFFDHAEDAS